MEDSRRHGLPRYGLAKKALGVVEPDGTVYSGTGWGLNAIGKVDADGTVHSGTGWSEETVGCVASPHIQLSGAALLLLLR